LTPRRGWISLDDVRVSPKHAEIVHGVSVASRQVRAPVDTS
jgi:hypothetical protein